MSEETKTLSQLQLDHLEKIKITLTNMGCLFVIELPDGELVGDTAKFERTLPKPKRAAPEFKRGEVRTYIHERIADMKPGEVRKIPCDKYGIERIQSGTGNYCREEWGPNAWVTARRPEENAVEVLRTDGV